MGENADFQMWRNSIQLVSVPYDRLELWICLERISVF
jgi:hypothetical protein